MNKQFKLAIISIIILLISAISVQAGESAVDSVSASSDCDDVTVTWSHSSGDSTTINIFASGFTPIGSGSSGSNSGSMTINISPDLSDGETVTIEIEVSESGGRLRGYTIFDITCTEPEPEPDPVTVSETSTTVEPAETEEPAPQFLCRDGRLTYTQCNPLIIYNVVSDDGIGIVIYTSDKESNGIGEFVLEVPAEIFGALPANPANNCTIASSTDGSVVVYLLTTGEIQVNAGPDEVDDKVFIYIFSDLISAPTSMDTYITLEAIEILPACIG